MKSHLISLLAVLALGTASSQAAIYSLSGTMDPLQAGTNGGFGGGSGSGSGTISGLYDDVTNLLDYNISWTGLTASVTNAHFHLGAPGVSGGVQLGIPDQTSPSIGSGVSVSAANEPNLLAGNWYVNIHTSAFTGGEIRGQVNVTPIPEPSSSFLALGGLGLLLIRKRRA